MYAASKDTRLKIRDLRLEITNTFRSCRLVFVLQIKCNKAWGTGGGGSLTQKLLLQQWPAPKQQICLGPWLLLMPPCSSGSSQKWLQWISELLLPDDQKTPRKQGLSFSHSVTCYTQKTSVFASTPTWSRVLQPSTSTPTGWVSCRLSFSSLSSTSWGRRLSSCKHTTAWAKDISAQFCLCGVFWHLWSGRERDLEGKVTTRWINSPKTWEFVLTDTYFNT